MNREVIENTMSHSAINYFNFKFDIDFVPLDIITNTELFVLNNNEYNSKNSDTGIKNKSFIWFNLSTSKTTSKYDSKIIDISFTEYDDKYYIYYCEDAGAKNKKDVKLIVKYTVYESLIYIFYLLRNNLSKDELKCYVSLDI